MTIPAPRKARPAPVATELPPAETSAHHIPNLPQRDAPLPPALRLTLSLVLAGRRWRALLDDRLRPLGQSGARMEAMAVIARAPPGSAQIEIARRIGIEGATFTRMLDALEGDGLVERHPHPTDRRTKHIRLTPAGTDMLVRVLDLADVLRSQLLATVDPAEVDHANRFLDGLLSQMERGLPAAES